MTSAGACSGGLFISGTDTDVGKTVITAGLLRALLAPGSAGVRPVACKPVQTGCVPDANGMLRAPDAALYARAAQGQRPAHQAVAEPLYCFSRPCSPHLAAASENTRISVPRIVQSVTTLRQEGFFPLVEGAGGLFVPLNEGQTMLDLAADLHLPVLLVAANRLGVINHILLSLHALHSRGLRVAGVVFNNAAAPHSHDSTTALLLRDNIETVRRFSGLPATSVITEIPYLPELAQESALALSDPAAACTSAPGPKGEKAWTALAECLAPLAERLVSLTAALAPSQGTSAGHNTPATAQALLDFDRRHIWHPYTSALSPLPVREATGAKGCRITLRDGQELIDGMASWWCAVHGYGHPRLVAAMQRQAAQMPHVMFGGLTHQPAVDLARKLLPLLPQGLEHIFFADSGSVSIEVAMKMAMQYWQAQGGSAQGKNAFLTPRGGYHGDTLGAMSVCDPVNGMHGLFSGTLPQQFFVERPRCRFDQPFDPASTNAIEKALAEKHQRIAAVILEPIVQGAGGMWLYHPDYLRRVRALCDHYDVLLIADEIATGFGRTGKFFACEWAGVAPDILCLGKALTGGTMTLAATAASRRVAHGISQGGGVFMHGPTFMGNPLACAVACESLDLLQESQWQRNVLRLENSLQQGLEPCRDLPGVLDVRVLGGIGVVELDKPVDMARMQDFFVQHGVWVRPFGRLVYLMPPYVATQEDLSTLTHVVAKAVETCR